MTQGDWRGRADVVRGIPLRTNLLQRGATRDPGDKAKWHTERGVQSLTGIRFRNWCQEFGGGGAIDLVMHLADLGFQQAVVWLEQHLGTSHTAVLETSSDRDQPSSQRRPLRQSATTPAIAKSLSTANLPRQLSLPVPDPSKLNQVRYLTRTFSLFR